MKTIFIIAGGIADLPDPELEGLYAAWNRGDAVTRRPRKMRLLRESACRG